MHKNFFFGSLINALKLASSGHLSYCASFLAQIAAWSGPRQGTTCPTGGLVSQPLSANAARNTCIKRQHEAAVLNIFSPGH